MHGCVSNLPQVIRFTLQDTTNKGNKAWKGVKNRTKRQSLYGTANERIPMDKGKLQKRGKKIWHFLWEEDSIWSWIANIALAFLLIKFIVYPGLGLMFGTKFPVVAVISTSMEHDGAFGQWWERQHAWYETKSITKDQFLTYTFTNGFNKGDIMVLIGKQPSDIKQGDVIVFKNTLRTEPIIHRVITIAHDENRYRFTTKGDKNFESYSFEQDITQDRLLGRAMFRIPFLGYVKIIFMDIINWL